MTFMDLLFKKYASPFVLLDGYIQTSRFGEFIHAFVKQKQEDDKWEFYLHKVWGNVSYKEYCEALQTPQEEHGMSEDEIKTTIQKSKEILGTFHPQEEGEI